MFLHIFQDRAGELINFWTWNNEAEKADADFARCAECCLEISAILAFKLTVLDRKEAKLPEWAPPGSTRALEWWGYKNAQRRAAFTFTLDDDAPVKTLDELGNVLIAVAGATVRFTREDVLAYLDGSIRIYQSLMTSTRDQVRRLMAEHYVDAFQSMRNSLFGELLTENTSTGAP